MKFESSKMEAFRYGFPGMLRDHFGDSLQEACEQKKQQLHALRIDSRGFWLRRKQHQLRQLLANPMEHKVAIQRRYRWAGRHHVPLVRIMYDQQVEKLQREIAELEQCEELRVAQQLLLAIQDLTQRLKED